MTAVKAKTPGAELSRAVWFGGLAVRTAFIAILIVITASVASPQLENIWSIWETPSDVARLALGAAVCCWLLVHFFIVPRDPGGYRTWLYLGPVLLPLALLVAVIAW